MSAEVVVDVDEAAFAEELDAARVASLQAADQAAAQQKPLPEWPDAELAARFAESQMLPRVNPPLPAPECCALHQGGRHL